VDDGSGANINCKIEAKKQSINSNPGLVATRWDQPPPPPPEYGDFDVGHVVEVKGGLCTFRDDKQINVETIRHVRSTAEEVNLWEKRTDFLLNVLEPPWILSKAQIKEYKEESELSAGAELAIIQGKRKLKTATAADDGIDLGAYKIRKRRPNSDRECGNETGRKMKPHSGGALGFDRLEPISEQQPVPKVEPYRIRKRTSNETRTTGILGNGMNPASATTWETSDGVPTEPNPYRIKKRTSNTSVGAAAEARYTSWALEPEKVSLMAAQPQPGVPPRWPTNVMKESESWHADENPYRIRKRRPQVPCWAIEE
jgi:hypothetical protein